MIHEPRKSTEVAGHGDYRKGVFIECDTDSEIEWLLDWLVMLMKRFGILK